MQETLLAQRLGLLSRSVKKEYLALVIGEPKEPGYDYKPYRQEPKQAQDGRRAPRKEAITEYRVL